MIERTLVGALLVLAVFGVVPSTEAAPEVSPLCVSCDAEPTEN
ncbi:hypothetical protein [Georgenia alba]|uniref:Uncharacterized protein n=1 Tax=Georgenia alba TaxID=2233858 RepID=A0ABW2Q2V1_9MICO